MVTFERSGKILQGPHPGFRPPWAQERTSRFDVMALNQEANR
jgi:hypothetical protein